VAKQLVAGSADANRAARCWIGLIYDSLPFGDPTAIASVHELAEYTGVSIGRVFARPVG
jgi:hypothetical protein